MTKIHEFRLADTKEHRCEKMEALDPGENWWIDSVYNLNVETESYDKDEESCRGFRCIPIEFCPFCGMKLK